MANVLVLLLDMNNKPVTYDWTDANGEFAFKNIAFGEYQVWTEIPGKTTIPSMVEIDSDDPEIKDLQISVGATVITGIFNGPQTYEPLLLKVFPNPANRNIFIRHKSAEGGSLQITLRNNLGQVILVKEMAVHPNTIQNERINVEALPKGLYFVEVLRSNTNDATSWIQKVVVK